MVDALECRISDLAALIEAQHGEVVSRTAKLLYAKDTRIATLEAQLAKLAAENERLRAPVMAQSRAIHSPETLASTGAVKVKPLEWEEASVGRWSAEVEGFPFRYIVRINLKGHIRIKTFGLYEVFSGTLDEAFEYVQAEHDRRILSALVPNH